MRLEHGTPLNASPVPTDMFAYEREPKLRMVMPITADLARDVYVQIGDLAFCITRDEMIDGLTIDVFARRLMTMLDLQKKADYSRDNS